MEHAKGAVGDDDNDALVDLNLMCIVTYQFEHKDSWCGFCSEDKYDFDDDFDELYGNIDVSKAFVSYEVDFNNFNFSDALLDTVLQEGDKWKAAVLQEEKMYKKYNIFTEVDDESSKEGTDEDDDDDNSEPDNSVIRNWSPKDVNQDNIWDRSLHNKESEWQSIKFECASFACHSCDGSG